MAIRHPDSCLRVLEQSDAILAARIFGGNNLKTIRAGNTKASSVRADPGAPGPIGEDALVVLMVGPTRDLNIGHFGFSQAEQTLAISGDPKATAGSRGNRFDHPFREPAFDPKALETPWFESRQAATAGPYPDIVFGVLKGKA